MAQARRKKKSSGGSSHGLGMFVSGLVTGAVAMGLFQGWNSDDPTSIGRGLAHMMDSSRQTTQGHSASVKGKPSDDPVSTSLDFYTMLPEIETIIPDSEAPVEAVPTPTRKVPESNQNKTTSPQPAINTPQPQGVRFELQAGAFARSQDADRLKARLALAGLESRIQKVTIQNRGDFYRVRLGPFVTAQGLNSATGKLAEMGIKPLRFKLAGG